MKNKKVKNDEPFRRRYDLRYLMEKLSKVNIYDDSEYLRLNQLLPKWVFLQPLIQVSHSKSFTTKWWHGMVLKKGFGRIWQYGNDNISKVARLTLVKSILASLNICLGC